MGFEVENGMIKSFNSKSDSKAPETIAALTGIATAKAALVTADAAMKTAMKELAPSADKAVPLGGEKEYAVTPVMNALAKLNSEVIKTLAESEEKKNFERELKLLDKQVKVLQGIGKVSFKQDNPEGLISKIEEYRKISADVASQLKSVGAVIDVVAADQKTFPKEFKYAMAVKEPISDVIKELEQFSERRSSIAGLYEIKFTGGELTLRKVAF